jgi:hypothetical protein
MEKNLDGFLLSNKVATAKDDTQKEAWTNKKTSAAGVIGRHLSKDNVSQFITDKNCHKPHLIWEALCKHFKSSSLQNQAKVYQKFLKLGFQSNLRDFLTSHLMLTKLLQSKWNWHIWHPPNHTQTDARKANTIRWLGTKRSVVKNFTPTSNQKMRKKSELKRKKRPKSKQNLWPR